MAVFLEITKSMSNSILHHTISQKIEYVEQRSSITDNLNQILVVSRQQLFPLMSISPLTYTARRQEYISTFTRKVYESKFYVWSIPLTRLNQYLYVRSLVSFQ